MLRRAALILLALVLLVAGALTIQHLRRPPGSSGHLTLYGNVDLRQLELAFKDSERIARVLVEEGERVTAGQLLAELETDRLDAAIAAARARVEAQQQSLNRLENGTRPEVIDQARADLVAAEAEVRRAERTLERVKDLAPSGATTAQDVDNATAAREVARARRDAQRKALELDLAGPRDEDIAEARSLLGALRADLGVLSRKRDDTRLVAPAAGTVRNRILEPGEMASPARAVFSLALVDPKWIRAYVSEPDLGRIRPGMSARVRTDSTPDRVLEGRVGFISPVAEFTPKSVETTDLRTSLVYEVRVLVSDAGDTLRLGMPATVEFDLEKQSGSASPGASVTASENGDDA